MRISEKHWALGIDIGSSAIKGLLLSRDGAIDELDAVPTPWNYTDGKIEMTVEAMAAALKETIGKLPRPEEIAAVGITGMAESGAAFDSRLRPASRVLAWNDPRGQHTAEWLRSQFPGIDQKIGQRLRYIASAAKVGDLFGVSGETVHMWLGVPEICLWMLTGKTATEHSLVSRTGWYDLREKAYLPKIADAVGLSYQPCLDVMTAGDVMGSLAAGASWSGLTAGVPVTIAGHDHLVAALALGLRAGDMGNSVGTAESVVRIHKDPPDLNASTKKGLAASLAPGGKDFGLLAGAGRAGIVLTRLANRLGSSPERLDELVASNAPIHLDPAACVALVRAVQEQSRCELPGDPAAAWAMALEGLSLRTLEAAERLGGKCDGLVVFGGGACSAPWLTVKARLFKRPIYTADVSSAAAAGAAMFAGVAAGWWTSLSEANTIELRAFQSQR